LPQPPAEKPGAEKADAGGATLSDLRRNDMDDEPNKCGLALSGGGFRATLFHLGVIRYLHETGGLSEITHITSVSGGSVIAAHLVLNWELYTGDNETFKEAANELVAFIKHDVRGRIVRSIPVNFFIYWITVFLRQIPFIRRVTKLRITKVSTTDILEQYYSGHRLFKGKTLSDLKGGKAKKGEKAQKRPLLYLLATNLDDADKAASFTSKGIHTSKTYSAAAWPLGRAVAASSAFPGMFPPVSFDPGHDEDTLKLVDGGVYDNLGVRKFWDLLENGSIDLDEVIVSDASAAFKRAAKRPFLEPITTPFRAVDILYRRIYNLDKKFAAHIDKELPSCRFRILSLDESIDTDDDDLALMEEHQEELKFIRTDLDKFTDMEIAALVRHGYCVATSVFGKVADREKEEWSAYDPVPATKDSLTREMIAREATNGGRIKDLLCQSSKRKYRIFSYDLASLVTVSVLAMFLGWFIVPPLLFILGKRNTETQPTVDQKVLESNISSSKEKYKDILWSREESLPNSSGFDAEAKNTETDKLRKTQSQSLPLETWTTSQAAYSLIKAGYVKPDNVNFFIESIESRFFPSSKNNYSDWNPEIGGWYTGQSQHQLQVEPALWTLAAICALLQSSEIDDIDRKNLSAKADQIENYLSANNFYTYDKEKSELAFNVLANQKELNLHSSYSTSLALLALLEMKKNQLNWTAKKPETQIQTDQMIRAIVHWLENSYSEGLSGWNSIDGDLNPKDEAVNLQIMSIMLQAYVDMGIPVSDNMSQRVGEHLTALARKFPIDSSARVVRDTSDFHGKSQSSDISIPFIWRPWAIKLCRSWSRYLPNGSTEKQNTLGLLGKLTSDLSDAEEADESDLTSHSAEMLMALS
jgi:predicted acylesterase/phospholipase RssA